MTIDEAIKYLENTLRGYKERCNSEWCSKDREALAVLTKCADWLREQDLIKRSDVITAIKTDVCYAHTHGFRDTECGDCVQCNIKHIPKAEPPTSFKMEQVRNGDCETCKHYDEPKYCNNCYVRDDEMPNAYEPYIPKE